jgi:hypothetical protein
MPRIKKFAPKLTTNLTNIQTFLLDTVFESEYFRITEFKDTFTGGKNGFLIEGSEYLKETTEVKIEILDVDGNPIYYEVARGNPQYYETTSILVAVYIYNTTPVGPAKITILGEAKTYNDNGVVRNIPDEWQNVYNVKWERSFKVNRNLPNTDRVRFKYRPEIEVSEISGSVFLSQLTEVTQIGTVNGYPITPEVGTVLSNKYYGDLLYKVIKSGSGLNKKPEIDSPYWEGGKDWDSIPVFDFYLLEKCNPDEGDTNVYYLSNPTVIFGTDLLNPIIPYNQALNLKIGDDIPQTYLLRGIMKLNQYAENVLTPVTSTGVIPSVDILSPTYPFVYGCSGELSPGYLPPPTINSTNTSTSTDDIVNVLNTTISVYTQVENNGGNDIITAYATIVPSVPQEVIINTSVSYSSPFGGVVDVGLQIIVPASSVLSNSDGYDTGLTNVTVLSSCLEGHTFIENANVTVVNACIGYVPQPTIPIPNPITPPTPAEDIDDGGSFPGQTLLGARITIPSASIYNEPIFQFLNDTELVIQKPYLENGSVDEFSQFEYELTYNIISNFATSSLASSYGNFRINNLNTYVGDVKRVKIFYKPTRDITQYELLDDIKIESTELLKEEFSGSFVEYGNFTASYVDYWVTSSNVNYEVSTSNATVFAALSVENISPTTESFSIFTTESFLLNKGEEYTFYTNIKYTGELGDDVYFKVYLSGSSVYGDTSQNIIVLNPVPQNLNQQRLEQNVIIGESGDYKLIIETFGDRWDFGAVSFKSSQEEYFSPDYFEFNIPIPRLRPQEYFDFKFEFYDINNNYIPTDIFVNKVLFKEGKTVLPVSSDDLSGLVGELIDEINDLKGEISNKPIYKYGEVLFGTGTTIISQSANLYWDIPNKRLGVGRKDPQYDVDISGSVRITDNLIVSGSTQFGDNSVDTHIFTGSMELMGDESIDGNLYVNEFPIYQESLHDAFTGLINGGVITIDGTNGQVYRISSGSGYIINNYTDSINPTYQYISWPDLIVTASAFPGPGQNATTPRTNIAINSSGNVYEKTDKFTPQDYRNYIVLGRIVHTNNNVITRTLSLPLTTYNRGFHWFDLANSIGPVNVTGNIYSAGGTDLTIQKSAGQTYRIGSNYKNNSAFPDITTDAISNPTSFRYRYRSGSEFIELPSTTYVTGSRYDNGSGTLQTVNNNQWTVQRIFFFGATATTIIQFGQTVYNNKLDAEVSVLSEPFQTDTNLLDDALLRGYLLIRGGASNLSNPNDGEFLEAVGGGAGGGGGGGATTLESLTDVSYPTTLIPGQTIVYDGSEWVNGYPATASFASTASYVNPLVQNVIITGSVNISGSITASLAPGNIWIGDENGQNIQVSTSSILPTVSGVSPISVSYDSGTRNYQISHTQSGVTPGTYNSITVDIYGHVTSGSVEITGHTIQDSGSDMPQQENLNFVRMIVEDDSPNNATIVKRPPSVTVSGSAPTKDIMEGDEWINDETWKKYVRYDDFWVETGKIDCTTTLVNISGSSTTISIPTDQIGFGNELNELTSSAELKWNNVNNTLIVTGSVQIQGGITASLQQGYVWVGDSNGVNNQIPTSSISVDLSIIDIGNVSGSFQINLNQGRRFKMIQTHNATMDIINPTLGYDYVFEVSRSANLIFGYQSGKFRFPLGSAPILTNPTTNGSSPSASIDILTGLCMRIGRLDLVITPDLKEN